MIIRAIWFLLLLVMVLMAVGVEEKPLELPRFFWAIAGMCLAFMLGQASITLFH